MFGNPQQHRVDGPKVSIIGSYDIRRGHQIKEGTDIVGNKANIRVVKTKLRHLKQVQLDIIYGKGVSAIGEIIDLAVEHDLIDKSGSWYSYGDHRIGQRTAVQTYLEENPDVKEELAEKIREIILPEKE